MSSAHSQSQPNPMRFFEAVNGFHQTEALRTAINLELFTAIAEGSTSAAQIAKKCGTAERGARILCDYLTVIGFLIKNGNSYGLTPDSAVFLVRTSPAYIGSAVHFLASSDHMKGFGALTDAVRKGGTAVPQGGTTAPDHPMWIEFANSMGNFMSPAAEAIAALIKADAGAPCKVLDIAAGHGKFGITIARHNPKAQIVALDWADVLKVAKQNADNAGVSARYTTLAGSAFDVDFGSGFDVVLLTNFLHHFDAPTNEKLLRKVHAALKPGGRAITLEFVPNDDRVTPPLPASFSLIMLAGTPSGDAFTFREFEQMFRNAGFKSTTAHPAGPSPEMLLDSMK